MTMSMGKQEMNNCVHEGEKTKTRKDGDGNCEGSASRTARNHHARQGTKKDLRSCHFEKVAMMTTTDTPTADMSITRLPLRTPIAASRLCLRCFSSGPQKQGTTAMPPSASPPKPRTKPSQMMPSSPSSAIAVPPAIAQSPSSNQAAHPWLRVLPEKPASNGQHRHAR